MKDESWYIELLKVLSKVRLGKGLDAVIARFHPSHHPLQPPVLPDAFGNLGTGPVVSVEREGNVLIKLGPRLHILSSEVIEHRDRRARRLLVRLHHQRRHRSDADGHPDWIRAMPPK